MEKKYVANSDHWLAAQPPPTNQEVYEIRFLKDFFFSETRQAQFHPHAPTQMVWGWLEDEMPVQAKAEVLNLFHERPHSVFEDF